MKLFGFLALMQLLAAVAQPSCLMINDFNREYLVKPVSFSTVGEMYGDDDSIGNGGVFRLDHYQLLVRPPPTRSSFWFMEFEPHCIAYNNVPFVTSSNPAYHKFRSFDTMRFDLKSSPGADFSISLEGGNFTQCDMGEWSQSSIQLAQYHRPNGELTTVSIPLAAWKTASFDPSIGLHAVGFGFGANRDNVEFRFDNFQLCEGEANPSPRPRHAKPSDVSSKPVSTQPTQYLRKEPVPVPSVITPVQENGTENGINTEKQGTIPSAHEIRLSTDNGTNTENQGKVASAQENRSKTENQANTEKQGNIREEVQKQPSDIVRKQDPTLEDRESINVVEKRTEDPLKNAPKSTNVVEKRAEDPLKNEPKSTNVVEKRKDDFRNDATVPGRVSSERVNISLSDEIVSDSRPTVDLAFLPLIVGILAFALFLY